MSNRLNDILSSSEVIGSSNRMFAIASGKGGVGKSIISFNLAWALSEHGKVLLIDGDFYMSNLHLLANVSPKLGWRDICQGKTDLLNSALKLNDNLHFLAASGLASSDKMPELQEVADSMAIIRKQGKSYDYIIIDTGACIQPHTNIIFNLVDEVVLVTSPELTSISDSYALAKILYSNNDQISLSLMVNRVANLQEAEYIHEKFGEICNQFLGKNPGLFGSLGSDPLVTESVAGQVPILKMNRDSGVAGQLRNLAESLKPGLRGRRSGQINDTKTLNSQMVGADIKE